MARALLVASLLLSTFVACNGDKPTSGAVADSARPATVVASASASAAEAGSAAATASDPAAATGAASATGAGSAAAAPARASSSLEIPKPKNGVLAPGEADKLLKPNDPPKVKLLEPGAEPREKVVYELVKGGKSTMTMAMDILMTMNVSGQSLNAGLPRMTMTFDNTTSDAKGGDFKIDGLLSKVAVDDGKDPQQKQLATAMRAQTEKIKGLSMSYWVSPSGYVHDVKVDVPAGFPAEAQQLVQGMNQSFASMISPFPSEPVGVGAKWRVLTRIQSGGADLLQYADYVLKSREGKTLKLDVAVQAFGANDTINPPGTPAGVVAKLGDFKQTGTGSNALDLKSIAPTSGAMSINNAMDIAVSQGKKSEKTSIATTMTVTFTGKP